ncbi:MAG: hypothetical protein WAO19_00520 [Candidatus Kryptoniota bacterium]
MVRFLSRVGILVLAAMFVAGCSKSSSTGNNSTAPALKAPTFAGPSSTSTTADTSAGYLYASTYANIFTAYSESFTEYFVGTGTQSGNSWTWTETANGITGTWTATSTSSGYNWSLVLNGSNGTTTYNNFTIVSGTESTNGSSGSWTLYYENETTAEFGVTWSTDANGVVTGTIVSNDSSGTAVQKDVITENPNKSGELKEYAGGTVLTWDIIWNANGSGSYTEWNTDGTVEATGTWS